MCPQRTLVSGLCFVTGLFYKRVLFLHVVSCYHVTEEEES